ncbi:Heterogeneous nuclear ribonucleoprotein D0 [Astathelohania contejeani]|uniref:Heterogeneous nuclear ribonucleoprotein D0 n=1 Tax=Astathelohania contejeani TaxID=164912 RepID=A0ABQ7HXS9_9MICR|nr:Heterogeneous nuclear ribonucleoprotein D0 [Thelohania contejeani]
MEKKKNKKDNKNEKKKKNNKDNKNEKKKKNKKDNKNERKETEYNKKNKTTKISISNLSYKETKHSLLEYFSRFGEITNVFINKNKEGMATGKGVITFSKTPQPSIFKDEIILNGKILQIKRIKMEDELEPTNTIFISHINPKLTTKDIRDILGNIFKVVNIRMKKHAERKRNYGYCFLEFKDVTSAIEFKTNYSNIKDKFGINSNIEFSKDKPKYAR